MGRVAAPARRQAALRERGARCGTATAHAKDSVARLNGKAVCGGMQCETAAPLRRRSCGPRSCAAHAHRRRRRRGDKRLHDAAGTPQSVQGGRARACASTTFRDVRGRCPSNKALTQPPCSCTASASVPDCNRHVPAWRCAMSCTSCQMMGTASKPAAFTTSARRAASDRASICDGFGGVSSDSQCIALCGDAPQSRRGHPTWPRQRQGPRTRSPHPLQPADPRFSQAANGSGALFRTSSAL